MKRERIIVEFATCIAAMSGAGNAYHVIAAHQANEATCRWPVCESVRQTRKDVETLIDDLLREELAE